MAQINFEKLQAKMEEYQEKLRKAYVENHEGNDLKHFELDRRIGVLAVVHKFMTELKEEE